MDVTLQRVGEQWRSKTDGDSSNPERSQCYNEGKRYLDDGIAVKKKNKKQRFNGAA